MDRIHVLLGAQPKAILKAYQYLDLEPIFIPELHLVIWQVITVPEHIQGAFPSLLSNQPVLCRITGHLNPLHKNITGSGYLTLGPWGLQYSI